MGEQRTSGEGMHDLGQVRAHALALSRSENDDLQGGGGAHPTKRAGLPLPGCVAPLIKEFRDPPSTTGENLTTSAPAAQLADRVDLRRGLGQLRLGLGLIY